MFCMALPLLPLFALAGSSLATSAALQARALRADDLEPRLFGVSLAGVALGTGVLAGILAPGVWAAAGAGVALGSAQSVVTSSQVAHATDPQTLAKRGTAPAWLVGAGLVPQT